MPSYIKVTPGREFDTLGVVKETVASLSAEGGVGADELAGIRSFLVKNHREAVRDNAYWLKVQRLTPASVETFGRRNLLPAHKAALVMSAEASE